MATGLSKADYLKRYLSGADASDVGDKRKKKKKRAKAALAKSSVKIIDDDIETVLPENLTNTLEEDVGDNEPTVADFVDERPEEIKQMERFRADKKWKLMTDTKKAEAEESSDGIVIGGYSDQSPARRERYDSESDQSPARRQRHDSESDQSPARRQRHDSESDQSPARRQRHDSDSDQSPVRRQRHDSDSDQSPARRQQGVASDSDRSPARKRQRDPDSDQSPPRKKRYDSDSDQSPPRKKRYDSDSDQSPPRKKRHDPDSDQSPPRRKKHDPDSDQSLPRRKKGHDTDSHQSRKQRRDPDSPDSLTKTKRDRERSRPRKKRWDSDSERGRTRGSDVDLSPPRRSYGKTQEAMDEKGRAKTTLSGATAGLQSGKAMKEEALRLKKKEDEAFESIGDDHLGKNATTVFRDKSGRRRNLKEEKRKQREEDQKKAEEVEKYAQWGKGLKQQEDQQHNLEAALHEMSKPLARYKDDKDLDEEMRAQERAGDPMLAFIKKKKSKSAGPAKPRYRGPQPPPNRFGIMPGYRWDGVDRSTGFEKQFFLKKAERKAVKEMAYKWSVEDM